MATGYFGIGALLDLNGEWQQVHEIRILMGDEVSGRTKAKVLEGIQKRAGEVLAASELLADMDCGVDHGLGR